MCDSTWALMWAPSSRLQLSCLEGSSHRDGDTGTHRISSSVQSVALRGPLDKSHLLGAFAKVGCSERHVALMSVRCEGEAAAQISNQTATCASGCWI